MLYAIISDVHANLEALTVCLDELDKIKPDRIVCLGDLVDYCAQPNEIVEIIKSKCDVVILGNHDEGQFNYGIVEGFSEKAYASSCHTRTVINAEHIEYFKTLPYTHSENDLLFVHGSPRIPEMYQYIFSEESAEINFKHFTEKVCFIGHSHLPVVFEDNGKQIQTVKPGKLNPENKYIINVGSVGQPRDGNPKLSFGLFDTEKFEYKNIRLDYDIKSASEKIKKEGLPEKLAMRLYEGV
jgi:diadenosine tetraphosphatase ApaH/serine/threonine PP2A family protein phosphatase